MTPQIHDEDPGGQIYAWHDESDMCHLMTEKPTTQFWASITSPANLAAMQWDHIGRLTKPPRPHVWVTRTKYRGQQSESYSVTLL